MAVEMVGQTSKPPEASAAATSSQLSIRNCIGKIIEWRGLQMPLFEIHPEE
jgi:hypothetical protein